MTFCHWRTTTARKDLTLWLYLDPANGLNRTAEADELVRAHRSITEPAIQAIFRRFAVVADSILKPAHIGPRARNESHPCRIACCAVCRGEAGRQRRRSGSPRKGDNRKTQRQRAGGSGVGTVRPDRTPASQRTSRISPSSTNSASRPIRILPASRPRSRSHPITTADSRRKERCR